MEKKKLSDMFLFEAVNKIVSWLLTKNKKVAHTENQEMWAKKLTEPNSSFPYICNITQQNFTQILQNDLLCQ